MAIKSKQFKSLCYVSLALIITGCASQQHQITEAEQYAANEEWLNAVLVYRKASVNAPGDIEFKSRLKQTELKAADYYYQEGTKLIDAGNEDGAVVKFQQGLVAMPDHSKLNQAMQELLARQEANRLYKEALANHNMGRTDEAKVLSRKALKISPGHEEAKHLLETIERSESERWNGKLALTSDEPITLNFRETDLKVAFEFIAKSFGINVVFDDAVKDVQVTLFAQDVTFEQAVNLLLMTTKTFYKEIGVNTVLVAPETREKREQYEDMIIRNFALRSIAAKEMASILKGVLGLKTILTNESLNTVIVRADRETLSLAEQIVAINDRKPAELILDVEILEVNRTKAEQIGLDIGSQITVTYGETDSSISKALSQGLIKLPPTILRFYKQDVDAKTLANPKIRVINAKPAKIHIGDRVPLRSSTIQDATGQTRTTFEYKDIGIKLTVEPAIHLDNSVTVKLGLEVSTLGQNLGTQDEPAYSIGTRNADTIMLLRDGETAILGGLIRDEDRNAKIKVPGLGDVPAIGSLFTTHDDQRTRTDVLLTITPRIVRAWDMPSEDSRSLYSGTSKNYSTKPLFAYLKGPYVKKAPAFSMDAEAAAYSEKQGAGSEKISLPEQKKAVSDATPPAARADKRKPKTKSPTKKKIKDKKSSPPQLAFGQKAYQTTVGGELGVTLIGENLSDVSDIPLEILYNPRLLKFVGDEQTGSFGEDIEIESEAEKGLIRINAKLSGSSNSRGLVELAKLRLTALKPGISYLVYRTTRFTLKDGKSVAAQLQTARVNVK